MYVRSPQEQKLKNWYRKIEFIIVLHVLKFEINNATC